METRCRHGGGNIWRDAAEIARGPTMKIVAWFAFAVVGVCLVWFPSRDVIPAWQARLGSGVVGTFVAEREECERTGKLQRESCTLYGRWVADDGNSRRDNVLIYDEPRGLRVGGTTEARDTGARNGVYATAGGFTFLLTSAMPIVGIVILVMVGIFAYYAVRGTKTDADDG
jgi:hypothetical protein